jgi:hypothetical protein
MASFFRSCYQVWYGDLDVNVHLLWIEGWFELIKMCCRLSSDQNPIDTSNRFSLNATNFGI